MSSATTLPGLHHITAMAGDPQRNLNFYAHILGQRLVKTTVNFDDPGTYHLYYADATGTPGTVVTFFPWIGARRGRVGTGEAATIAYAIPADSLTYWQARLHDFGITPAATTTRFGETVLPFHDPDGIRIELITTAAPIAVDHWAEGPIPAQHALRGFHSTTLQVQQNGATAALLTEIFGYTRVGQEGSRTRFASPLGGRAAVLDLVTLPGESRGSLGVGTIHHIAFRVPNDAAQAAWRARLVQAGQGVTEVRDRQYFRSIYFREPGGVLFEIATDTPGFLWDEDRAGLGRGLKLPPWLEDQRAAITAHLPPLTGIGANP